MKKRAVILAVCALIMLGSCGRNPVSPETSAPVTVPAEPSVPPSEPSAPAPEQPPLPVPTDITPPDGLADELNGLWKKIDGSTATIPLTAALHGFFGGDGDPPTHQTTPYAYLSLTAGSADLIFVTYPSEDEFAQARYSGIELEIIPVVKDALVFLVNVENPVDGVSLEQLREIYTGKITGWTALGGIDADIKPYQRTPNSGSQTLLTKLVMDGLEPVHPPTELIIAGMSGLVEVVSGYDNAREAIGYSVFYYVNNMYGNSRFKLLGVDGVKPSRDTISRGEYPLEDHYYAVIRKDTPSDSPARKLIDWLLTDDGQTLAARAGYIPMRALENVFPDETFDPVYLGDTDNSSGTGGARPKPADAIGEITQNGVRKPLSDIFYDGFNYIGHINGEITNRINSPSSASFYSDFANSPTLAENAKRPFTGIPNDYPNYEIVDYSEDERYIRINLPEDNPFFNRQFSFDIRLTADISPYGAGIDDFSVAYLYGRRMLPKADLFIPDVKLPWSPDVAERINRQLKEWTDEFPGSGFNAELLNMFVELKIYNLEADDYDISGYVYNLWPYYGKWGDYLSVSYHLETFDGPSFYMPMLYTICFDIKTGDTVNLAECLPRVPYSRGRVSEPITTFEPGTNYLPTIHYGYLPDEGSVITSAWLWYNTLGLYVTEPDGRKLQVVIHEWNRKAG